MSESKDEFVREAAKDLKAAYPDLTTDDVAIAWWAEVIVLAVEDEDEESRAQLAGATGDPEAWTAFAAIAIEGDDPEESWTQFLSYVAEDPDHVDRSRPVRGERGYDPVLARAAELAVRLVRGLLAGNPACLPR